MRRLRKKQRDRRMLSERAKVKKLWLRNQQLDCRTVLSKREGNRREIRRERENSLE